MENNLDKSKLIDLEDIRVGNMLYYTYDETYILRVDKIERIRFRKSFKCKILSPQNSKYIRLNGDLNSFALTVGDVYLLSRENKEDEKIETNS